MPEGQVVGKTKTLSTVESLRDDFEALGIEKGMVLLVHFVLERDRMGLWWACRCYHRASGGLGRDWNTCDARPLNRPQRSEPVGESTCS